MAPNSSAPLPVWDDVAAAQSGSPATAKGGFRLRRPSATIIAMPDIGLGSPRPSESTGALLMSPLSSPSGSPRQHPRAATPDMFRPTELHFAPGHHQPPPPLGVHPCEAEDEREAVPRQSTPVVVHPLARSRTLERMLSIGSSVGGEPRPPGAAGSVSEATPLLAENGPDSGKWYQGPVFVAGMKLGLLFTGFSALVLGTFWFGMPSVDPEDRPALKLPRSFDDLQALNALLHKYKDLYPGRICLCGVVAYLYVQAFSLPGSMYISILFGAAYGMLIGLILSCLCDATGSILCYTLSSILAPPLLEMPYYRKRVDKWRNKIMGDPAKGQQVGWDSVFAILLTLRILPFPPHWVANFVAPHLGIGVLFFWITCFIGIAPVSVIHVTIGSSLDQMTSADDFHILSLRNILGLGAVIVAVLIPVGLKRVFKTDLGDLGEEEEAEVLAIDTLDSLDDIPAPVPVEFDEHGLPRRYQAVDSGVLLAGPSEGDPAFDMEPTPVPARTRLPPLPIRFGKKNGKGKRPASPSPGPGSAAGPSGAPFVDTTEPVDDSDSGSAFSAYELSQTARSASIRSARRSHREKRPAPTSRGYGTIEIEPLEMPPKQASSRWWRFPSALQG